MPLPRSPVEFNNRVLCVIMGGGQGTRLFPLTRERSKPAVPLAGKYRLVDIPISNCINAGLKRVYVLTQFNSASLHRHISQSYKFDHFSRGFVDILSAEQTFTSTTWYEGTADAVRKNLIHLLTQEWDFVLILSGDQLYRMDYGAILAQHLESEADLTIATIPVDRAAATSLGIMQIADDRRITRFVEKPNEAAVLDSLRLTPGLRASLHVPGEEDRFLASMGIYVFNRAVMLKLLENSHTDFGKHIIPQAIGTHRVFSHVFQGYWEDIGTIRSFFEANLDMTAELPRFNFFDMNAPIYTRPRYLPASKFNGAHLDHAVISDGCIINRASISRSVIGVRTIIEEGAILHRTVVMGSDYFESAESIAQNRETGRPPVGVGRHTRLEDAIIDKNARIGSFCNLSPHGKTEDVDHPLYYVRDGVLIIPKNGVVPDGTTI
ncbi:MAG: glucose-1-phosphate adenylyltransferase [Limisphaerales bacterium]